MGATVQASAGFGLSLIAAPLLLLIDRALVPGPLLFSVIVLSVLMSLRDRHSIDLRGGGWVLSGRLVGVVPATAALAVLSARTFDWVFGGLVVLGVVLSLIHPHLRPTRGWAITVGLVSGFMGTISSIGGPPVALLYQHESGPRIRGTLSSVFLFGSVASTLALAATGLFGMTQLWLSLALAPGMVAGFTLSRFTVGWADRGATRPLVLGLSLASALVVLGRAWWGDAG